MDVTKLKWAKAEDAMGRSPQWKKRWRWPLKSRRQGVSTGIGTHANSVIEFDLPGQLRTVRSHMRARQWWYGPSRWCTEVRCSFKSTQMLLLPTGRQGSTDPARNKSNALAGLKVHPGVTATLAARRTNLRSLTCLDVDHRGRMWVCEVVNYRSHNGERPEGDRILILEDENGDGIMDTSKVFHQGTDVDSAMGICVSGQSSVIVSATPKYLGLYRREWRRYSRSTRAAV